MCVKVDRKEMKTKRSQKERREGRNRRKGRKERRMDGYRWIDRTKQASYSSFFLGPGDLHAMK